MTEGRGPMIPSYAFLHREHAAAYIDAQEGVMGCRAKWSEQEYGDWRMKKIEVLEHDYMESEQRKEKVKRQALNKLTQEEKEILGLL